MTTSAPSNPTLMAYLTTSAKYNAAPVPLDLPREEVLAFINQHAVRTQTVARMRKLLRIAALYDAAETAPAFSGMLLQGEREGTDYVRSCTALSILSWVGDDKQRDEARSYFVRMVQRAPAEGLHTEFANACFVLDHPPCTAALKEWAQRNRAALAERLAKETKAGNAGVASTLRMQLADADEFLNIRFRNLEEELAVCAKVRSLAPAAQTARLADLYLEVAPDATTRLAQWAAWTCMRQAKQPAQRQALAAEFLKAEKRYEKAPEAQAEEYLLLRARAMRAAMLFGASLDEKQGVWLGQQEDAGTDVLTLRKQWKYAHDPNDGEH